MRPHPSGQGKLDASLLAGTVYGSLQATERLELWGAAGHGQGELTLTLPTGPGVEDGYGLDDGRGRGAGDTP